MCQTTDYLLLPAVRVQWLELTGVDELYRFLRKSPKKKAKKKQQQKTKQNKAKKKKKKKNNNKKQQQQKPCLIIPRFKFQSKLRGWYLNFSSLGEIRIKVKSMVI